MAKPRRERNKPIVKAAAVESLATPASDAALELVTAFERQVGWQGWVAANRKHFEAWRSAVVTGVRASGYENPLGAGQVAAGEAEINMDNLRESIRHGGLNTRKRALLLQFEREMKLRGWLGRRNLRILSPDALSQVAMILRGRYPYFLGTEYLPDPTEQRQFFPIQHMDLERIPYPDESFDVFLAGEVFEHIAEPITAYREILRILKPGGVVVATFPFDFNEHATKVRARRANDGGIVHVEEPQYHGNPTAPDDGALVFTMPGWDILEVFRDIGCQKAAFNFLLSTRYGIVSDGPPGIFVFSAVKQKAD